MEYPIVLAFLAFLSTTLDDFAVILIFFGREFVKTKDICNSSTRHDFGSIILGQILAFTIITAISLVIGFGLRKTVSDSYIDLIGFLPILIGLYKVFEILHEDGYLSKCWDCLCCKSRKKLLSEEAEGENEPLVDSQDNRGVTGSFDRDSLSHRISSAYGSSGLFEKTNPMQDGLSPSRYRGDSLDHLPDIDAAKPSKAYACWRNPLLEEVLLFGLLFGVDNISIYVSLFSNSTDADILVTVIVFYVLLLFYIGVAIAVITKFPVVGSCLGNNSKYIVPFVLIGLGVYILYDSVIWTGSP